MIETFNIQCTPTDWLPYDRNERHIEIHEKDNNPAGKYWFNKTKNRMMH